MFLVFVSLRFLKQILTVIQAGLELSKQTKMASKIPALGGCLRAGINPSMLKGEQVMQPVVFQV